MNEQQSIETLTIQMPVARVRRPPQKPEKVGAEKLKAERIQEALKAVPAWTATEDETTLWRVKRFPTPVATIQYATFVSALATGLDIPVSVRSSKLQVTITLRGQKQDGARLPLTDEQIHLAVMLS